MGLQESNVIEWLSEWNELILPKNFNLVHSSSRMGQFFNCLKSWQVYLKPLLKVKNDSSHLWVTINHPLTLSAQILTSPHQEESLCSRKQNIPIVYNFWLTRDDKHCLVFTHWKLIFSLNYMDQEDSFLSFLYTIPFFYFVLTRKKFISPQVDNKYCLTFEELYIMCVHVYSKSAEK